MDPIKLKRRGPVARWFYAVGKLIELSRQFRLDAAEPKIEQAYYDIMVEAENEFTKPQKDAFAMTFYLLTKELGEP